MAYWLLKSERETWSWDQQKESGRKGAEWTGVRNYQARNNMRAMKDGDLGFFYLSGGDKSVVGIVKVVNEAHADSTDDTGQWECVDVAAVTDLPKPVTSQRSRQTQSLPGWCWSGIPACRAACFAHRMEYDLQAWWLAAASGLRRGRGRHT